MYNGVPNYLDSTIPIQLYQNLVSIYVILSEIDTYYHSLQVMQKLSLCH